MQNTQKIWSFAPGPHWEGLPASPRLPSCTTVFLLTMLVEKPAPQKKLLDKALTLIHITVAYLLNFISKELMMKD